MNILKMIIIGSLSFIGLTAYAGGIVTVKGHYRGDGTWVSSHIRTAPNNTVLDNLSYNGDPAIAPARSDAEIRAIAATQMPPPEATIYRNSSWLVTNSTVELGCMPYLAPSGVSPRSKVFQMSLYTKYGIKESSGYSPVVKFMEFAMRDGTTRWTDNIAIEHSEPNGMIVSVSNKWRYLSIDTLGVPPVEDIITVLKQATSVAAIVNGRRFVFSLSDIERDISAVLRACPNS